MPERLVDTNIVSYILKQHSQLQLYRPHLDGYDLVVSFQTVAELYEGAILARWGSAKWLALESLLATMRTVDTDDTVCEWWAEIRAFRKTQTIPVADCWIAATAVAHGVELVTHNPADFSGIPWLTVITEAP